MYGPNTSPQAWQFPITIMIDGVYGGLLFYCFVAGIHRGAWITSVHALDCSPPEEETQFVFGKVYLSLQGLIEWLSETMKRLHFLKFKLGKLANNFACVGARGWKQSLSWTTWESILCWNIWTIWMWKRMLSIILRNHRLPLQRDRCPSSVCLHLGIKNNNIWE